MASEKKKTSLAVVGAGPGGYAAAFLAADLGIETTLIDPSENPGGVCLYRGCIPAKVFLHIARLIDDARLADGWGVSFSKPKIDIGRLRDWKNNVVSGLTKGLGQLARRRKVAFLRGTARFAGSSVLEVEETDGGRTTLQAEHVIIATGTVPAPLPGLDMSSPLVMDSTGALELADVPRRLLVIGGGYIGLEMGTVYATLGSEVTVAEMMPDILPMADADLVREYKKNAAHFFKEFVTGALADVDVSGKKVKTTFRNAAKREEVVREDEFDKVLVTVGRKPVTDSLGLENTKVERDRKGYIKVNAERRTADPAVFAVGDVTGEPLLAHKASHEGRTAVEALAGKKAAFDPQAIPAVEFTEPEVAWCGLTEKEAEARGKRVAVARFPWAASGRAATLGRPYGLTKLVIDPETERILGGGLVGTGAGELIGEITLAVEMSALASDVARTIHPHPTLSETVMEAAEVFYGLATDIYRPKRG